METGVGGCSLQPHGEANINLQHQKHFIFENNSSTHTNLSFVVIRSNSASLPSAQKVPSFALFWGSCYTSQRRFPPTAWVPSSLPCRIPASLAFEMVLSGGQNRGCLPRLCRACRCAPGRWAVECGRGVQGGSTQQLSLP